MHLLRAWGPALLAAFLWLLSGGLELLTRRWTHPLSRVVDHLLAPETVPVVQLTAPSPWGVVMAGLSALTVAGAYAALLSLVRLRRREAPALTTTAAYWMCAVVGGAAAAAVQVLAEVVRALEAGAVTAALVDSQLLTAAHWGLVWGWLPALLAYLLDGETGPRTRWGVVASAALAYVGAAIAIVAVAPLADAARVDAIAHEPEPAPTGTPVPAVAPGEWQVDPRWCTSGQLEFTAGVVDAALGARVLPVYATNVSDAACVLESYPDVAFSDPVTSALDVGVEHGGGMGSEDPGVHRIEVPPGGEATTLLEWRAPAASAADPAGWLHVAAYHGAERQMVRVDTDITGGSVAVTAWELRGE